MKTPFRGLAFIPLFLLSTVSLIPAQIHDSFQGRAYQSTGVNMVYRLFVPKNYDAKRKYPMLVAMHGVGEKGNDNNIQVDREDLGSTWIEDNLQTRVPHFVMVPQCPTDLSWGSASAINTVHQILDSLKREFSLDTNRFYVAGLSRVPDRGGQGPGILTPGSSLRPAQSPGDSS